MSSSRKRTRRPTFTPPRRPCSNHRYSVCGATPSRSATSLTVNSLFMGWTFPPYGLRRDGPQLGGHTVITKGGQVRKALAAIPLAAPSPSSLSEEGYSSEVTL